MVLESFTKRCNPHDLPIINIYFIVISIDVNIYIRDKFPSYPWFNYKHINELGIDCCVKFSIYIKLMDCIVYHSNYELAFRLAPV